MQPTTRMALATLAAAIPDFMVAAMFLGTWLAPAPGREAMVGTLMLVMLLEFINVHSSAFMGQVMIGGVARGKKSLALLGLGAFYTVFVGGFALAFKQLWPLWSFWGLTLNRLLGVILGQAPAGEEALFMRRTWAATVLFYLVFAFVTTLLPIPRFGITPEVVDRANLTGGGLWIDEPWRVLAFGFLYFTAVGLSELSGHGWIGTEAVTPRAARAANG